MKQTPVKNTSPTQTKTPQVVALPDPHQETTQVPVQAPKRSLFGSFTKAFEVSPEEQERREAVRMAKLERKEAAQATEHERGLAKEAAKAEQERFEAEQQAAAEAAQAEQERFEAEQQAAAEAAQAEQERFEAEQQAAAEVAQAEQERFEAEQQAAAEVAQAEQTPTVPTDSPDAQETQTATVPTETPIEPEQPAEQATTQTAAVPVETPVEPTEPTETPSVPETQTAAIAPAIATEEVILQVPNKRSSESLLVPLIALLVNGIGLFVLLYKPKPKYKTILAKITEATCTTKHHMKLKRTGTTSTPTMVPEHHCEIKYTYTVDGTEYIDSLATKGNERYYKDAEIEIEYKIANPNETRMKRSKLNMKAIGYTLVALGTSVLLFMIIRKIIK
jgi:hypothetical protein